MDLYISNDGRTLENGKKTLRGFKNLFEEMNKYDDNIINVHVKGDTYYIRESLKFNLKNSLCQINFKTYKDEQPVICGGEKIENWEETKINGINAWRTYIEEVKQGKWYFHQLFVHNERQQRSRYPKKDLFYSEKYEGSKHEMFESVHNFKFQDIIDQFEINKDMEIVFDHYWIHDRAIVSTIDFENNEIVTDSNIKMAMQIWSEDDFYFDNVLCKMTEPGEWYLERESGYLYYIPKEGETINRTEILAPRVDKFIEITGDPDKSKYVRNINFDGISFEICNSAGIKNSTQAASNLTAAIKLKGAKDCSFKNCIVNNAGQYCFDIKEGCKRIEISNSILKNMGGGGIRINGSNDLSHKEIQTSEINVSKNEIIQGGRIYRDAIGVLSMHGFKNRISHNHIYDFYYSGLSCGYVWGFGDNVSRENIIEYNHVHKIGQKILSDLGAMYYLGIQPGTKIRNNIVHDVTVKHYGGSGIYLDEGASNMVIENNIVYDTQAPSFNMHYGRENILRNNIFISGKEGCIQLAKRESFIDNNTALNIYSNILVTNGQPVFTGGYSLDIKDDEIRSNSNVIWDRSNSKLMVYDDFGPPAGIRGPHEFIEWQQLGNDTISIFDDPHFKDIDNKDFALKEDSCAYKVGFKDIE